MPIVIAPFPSSVTRTTRSDSFLQFSLGATSLKVPPLLFFLLWLCNVTRRRPGKQSVFTVRIFHAADATRPLWSWATTRPSRCSINDDHRETPYHRDCRLLMCWYQLQDSWLCPFDVRCVRELRLERRRPLFNERRLKNKRWRYGRRCEWTWDGIYCTKCSWICIATDVITQITRWRAHSPGTI